MFVYFPSCNFTKACPETSEKIKNYLRERHGMKIAGCCRPGHKTLEAGDTAVTVCHTCAAIVGENKPESGQLSLLEFLDQLPHFPFPDLGGEEITVQDCWRVQDKPALHETVRSLLKKLNSKIVELPANRENADFCGEFPHSPVLPGNQAIAPRYFERVQARLELLSPEEREQRIREHCAHITTARAVCYCNSCLRGLRQGGVNGVHLLELLFGVK